MAKPEGLFPELGAFIAVIVKRSTRTAGEIAENGGLTRGGATVSDLKNGVNAQWDTLDRFAKGSGFRSALDMFTSGGDQLTSRLLRTWRSLPDDEARKGVLRAVKQMRDAAEESSTT